MVCCACWCVLCVSEIWRQRVYQSVQSITAVWKSLTWPHAISNYRLNQLFHIVGSTPRWHNRWWLRSTFKIRRDWHGRHVAISVLERQWCSERNPYQQRCHVYGRNASEWQSRFCCWRYGVTHGTWRSFTWKHCWMTLLAQYLCGPESNDAIQHCVRSRCSCVTQHHSLFDLLKRN